MAAPESALLFGQQNGRVSTSSLIWPNLVKFDVSKNVVAVLRLSDDSQREQRRRFLLETHLSFSASWLSFAFIPWSLMLQSNTKAIQSKCVLRCVLSVPLGAVYVFVWGPHYLCSEQVSVFITLFIRCSSYIWMKIFHKLNSLHFTLQKWRLMDLNFKTFSFITTAL